MTEVEILRDEQGKVYEFRSKGHTGYDEEGKDIVCAGVSVLLQTAVLGLEDYLKLKPQIEQKKGWLRCSLERDYFLNREIDAILETIVLGLQRLEEQYPDHIKVEEVSSDVVV